MCDAEYRIIDLFSTGPPPRRCCPARERSERDLYVRYVDYERDLRVGQETAAKARRQFDLDAPRTLLVRDEWRERRPPDALLRFCTQSVMALPMECIAAADGADACLVDGGEPMVVRARERSVVASKTLRVLDARRGALPLSVRVHASLDDSFVAVRLRFARWEAPP